MIQDNPDIILSSKLFIFFILRLFSWIEPFFSLDYCFSEFFHLKMKHFNPWNPWWIYLMMLRVKYPQKDQCHSLHHQDSRQSVHSSLLVLIHQDHLHLHHLQCSYLVKIHFPALVPERDISLILHLVEWSLQDIRRQTEESQLLKALWKSMILSKRSL